jgi:hypothetical protein
VGLLHDPATEKFYDNPSTTLSLANLLIAVIRSYDLSSSDNVEERMKDIGRYLQGIARAEAVVFRSFISDVAKQLLIRWIDSGKHCLGLYKNSPTRWAFDVERWVLELEGTINPISRLTSGSLVTESESELRLIQKYFLNYSLLLQAWPDIVDASRHLRQRGYRLAREVQ